MRPVTRRGAGDPVVLIHGFTQTLRSWDVVAGRLAGHHEVLTIDAPGHGEAGDWEADLWSGARGIGDAAGRATYVGYSMGGRLALHLALARPDLVAGLVLISTSAGIDDPGQRAQRRRSDEALARRLETQGVDAFVTWWLAQPMWSTLPRDVAGRRDRLSNTAAGLASSLRLAGAGTQEPLWPRLSELAMPVLVVAGALDTPYAAAAQRLGRAIAHSEVVIVAGAGHACHLERPEAVVGALERWLTDQGDSQTQAQSEQRAEGQLQPSSGPQDLDEIPPARPARHRAHGRHGQGQGHQGQQSPRLPPGDGPQQDERHS
jgi:2-succinyl-6-hydroxy-2,4-cyclohexadiene-1-carboxylate synthase